MMRQARGARIHLQRLQTAREVRQSDKVACDATAAIEAAAASMIDDALASAPAATPPQPAASPRATRELTDAEKYALAHPSRAALIRSLGRLPKKFDGDPMPPSLVRDIVKSGSPILQALVKKAQHRLALAA
jgi:hypothetical protein